MNFAHFIWHPIRTTVAKFAAWGFLLTESTIEVRKDTMRGRRSDADLCRVRHHTRQHRSHIVNRRLLTSPDCYSIYNHTPQTVDIVAKLDKTRRKKYILTSLKKNRFEREKESADHRQCESGQDTRGVNIRSPDTDPDSIRIGIPDLDFVFG